MIALQASADDLADSMRPGILIVFGRIRNRQQFGQYVAQLPAVYQQFGGHYLALAPAPSVRLSGMAAADFEPVSVVVSVWPSLARVKQFWKSDEYQSVAALRAGAGDFFVAALDGAPQPLFDNQLAKPHIDLALLLDPQDLSSGFQAEPAIANGAVQALEGRFPATTIWLGWQASAPQTNAALKFIFPKLPH